MKRIVSFILFISWTVACAAPASSTSLPVQVATDTRPVPTIPTVYWTVVVPSLTPTPPPSWVGEFVAPVLTSLDGQVPVYQDDFDGSLNHGWFYFLPDSRRNPFQAHIQYETLWIELPRADERRDAWVYNPKLSSDDFVLTFDFQFEETQPPDYARFQFDQSPEHSVTFDLIKDKTWRLRWGLGPYTLQGSFDYFSPERIPVTIIMKGPACAVILNDTPVVYVEHCRPGSMVRSVPWAVSFHVISQPRYPAAVTIDNLKLWALD